MSLELEKAQKPKKDMDLLHTRTGGAYIPPAKLKMMQEQISDKNSEMYQRLNWERLKKRIHGQVNKANTSNLLNVIRDLLRENVIRGRGLLARSIIQAQSYSPTFSNVYAAVVAVINSHFPNIGMLIIHRLLIQFKRCYKRNDKASTVTISKFIAHLINQQVIHEILALEMMILMLENPTDDSVEVTVAFLKECGAKLSEISPRGLNAIFDRLRSILSDSDIDKRIQYMIEVIFHIRKDKFQAYPALIDDLDLIEEDDQITHTVTLEDPLVPENELNVFKYDPEFEKHEAEYEEIRRDAIGLAEGDSDEAEGEETPDEETTETQQEEKQSMVIIDNTEQNLVAFRRNIYLTIQSSLDFQEAAHKLLKIDLKSGQDVELCNMIVDCCAQQRTYEKFYGLLAERFCRLRKEFQEAFERIARDTYNTIHRFEYNKLRNMACLVAHLLSTDAISWDILDQISLNEEDTTSSGRIYIKIVFQELAEFLGVENLLQRIRDPTMQSSFDKIFPRDNPNNTRFSINFFTTIGLGYLTVDLRLHLNQARKRAQAKEEISSSSENSSSDSDSDESSSDSISSTSSSETSDSSDNEKSKHKMKGLQKNEKKKIPKIVQKKNHFSKNIGRENGSDWENGSHGGVSKVVSEKRKNDGEKMKIRSYDSINDRKMGSKHEEKRTGNERNESNGEKHKGYITGREDTKEQRNKRKKRDRNRREENEIEERKCSDKGKRRRSDSSDLENQGKHTNNEEVSQDNEVRGRKSKGDQRKGKQEIEVIKYKSKYRKHD
ncbi:Uncharacterized protein BM_BM3780 [Brugia malayi]|uniref:Lethal protein 858 n=1 Tax=Brugia malayi TaxID=6279 RepID=A0A0K0JBT5_BRUMA|nr:Uncharacterized protein BM_BM3780 [Brugia malayi]CTP81285.1 BMA-LET-858 [Brugia malayi]VIO94152.1 Uncharacterized protein BM_BM3780 [Brugia malayi]